MTMVMASAPFVPRSSLMNDKVWLDKHFQRELKTVRAMIEIHCHEVHKTPSGLCEDCDRLYDYVCERMQHCPFGVDKPTCAKCPVHCYRKEMREKIRQVMRYSGPRMVWRHPVLTAAHILRGAKEAPKQRPKRDISK